MLSVSWIPVVCCRVPRNCNIACFALVWHSLFCGRWSGESWNGGFPRFCSCVARPHLNHRRKGYCRTLPAIPIISNNRQQSQQSPTIANHPQHVRPHQWGRKDGSRSRSMARLNHATVLDWYRWNLLRGLSGSVSASCPSATRGSTYARLTYVMLRPRWPAMSCAERGVAQYRSMLCRTCSGSV